MLLLVISGLCSIFLAAKMLLTASQIHLFRGQHLLQMRFDAAKKLFG
jgi:hypothetical protein